MMRLLITTPTAVVVDHSDVVAIRADDETGSFGILSGHIDFLTALAISVVSWRRADGRGLYCAVRGGLLSVSGGSEVAIASRDATVGENLDHLEQVVLTDYRNAIETERASRIDTVRLHMKAIRKILKYLQPGRPGLLGEAP